MRPQSKKKDAIDPSHAKACKRSKGAKLKLKSFKEFCSDTGYMGVLCLKETWTRGKPRAFISKNWKGPIMVPMKRGDIGEGLDELVDFMENLELESDDDGAGDHNQYYQESQVGSPRTRRPQGGLHKKGKKKAPPSRRCHACGEVYIEELKAKWITCGGPGAKHKGCLWAAHLKCWNLQVPKQNLRDFCERIVRCKVCQEIEDDDDYEIPERRELAEEESSEDEEEAGKGEGEQDSSLRSPTPGTSGSRKKLALRRHDKKNTQVGRGLQKSNSQRKRNCSSDDDFQ